MEIENKRLRERISVMDDESLLSSDVFETDRSIKWDLSQQIEKLKRELHAANDRIKRLEEAGDAMAQDHNPFTFIDWQRVKEVKP
jgi:predicted  nucleic acid-binding Zn-ribbon protein